MLPDTIVLNRGFTDERGNPVGVFLPDAGIFLPQFGELLGYGASYC